MSNIIDYLIWRGDLSLSENKLNEIDKIILARISYLPFKEIKMKPGESIKDLAVKFSSINPSKFLWPDDVKLIELLGNSNRFRDIVITDYVEDIDLSAEKQFTAITLHLNENNLYVSFRGTDASLVGWKEDFNMSFSYNIPSQLEAVDYLNKIASKYEKSKFILGGHSKGGNVAVYAGIFCNDKFKTRIKEIINADGPGFSKSIINDKRYEKIKNKIKTYIPQTSIIGRILEHEEGYLIIQSTQKGIMQHDIYSWEIGPTFLIQIKEVTVGSQVANTFIREWLNSTSAEERKNFINIIYEILIDFDIYSTHDIPTTLLKNSKNIVNIYKNMDKNDKKQIENMISQFTTLATNILKNEIYSSIPNTKFHKKLT